ncbi:hypothetical protein T484DRAFT_3161109 [Baffinella frigidus]|nr:hypothetical protein T484DRAFT_3161109 [Cryptophyta sp. CCMP2293]
MSLALLDLLRFNRSEPQLLGKEDSPAGTARSQTGRLSVSSVPGDAAKQCASRRTIKLPSMAVPLSSPANRHASPSNVTLPRQQTRATSARSEDGWSSGLNTDHRARPASLKIPKSTNAPVRRTMSEPTRIRPPCKELRRRQSFYDARDRLRNLEQLRTTRDVPSSTSMRMSRLMRMEGERGRIPDEELGNIFATGEEKAVVGFAPVRLVWQAIVPTSPHHARGLETSTFDILQSRFLDS